MNSRVRTLLLVGTVVAASAAGLVPARASTACGGLVTNTIWTQADSPVTVTCDVVVFPGNTLTIDPGVEVRFNPGTGLAVRGLLSAIGTSSSHITLKSAASPTRWNGVRLQTNSGGRGVLQFVDVSDVNTGVSVECCWGVTVPADIQDSTFTVGGTAISGYAGNRIVIRRSIIDGFNVGLDSADKTVYDSTLRNNACAICYVERTDVYSSVFTNNGTALYGGGGTVRNSTISGSQIGVRSYSGVFALNKNTITGNQIGVLLNPDAYTPPITYNNIYGNAVENVRVTGSANKTISYNYWGTTDPAAIEATTTDGRDNPSLGLLQYQPFLYVPVTLDTTPPDTTITAEPPALSNTTTATFSFTSTDAPSTFECALDGAAFSSCSSPRSFTGLTDGSHTFATRATDPDGNTDATPAQATWNIDTVAPDTTIDTGPTGLVGSTDASLSFSSSDSGAIFECSLDDDTYTSCASPLEYSALGQGAHVFRVRAIDTAGNADPSAASRVWRIDATPPELTFLRPGPGLYVMNARTMNAGDTPLLVGPVTVEVRAYDEGSTLTSFSFSVDDVPVDPAGVAFDAATHVYRFTYGQGTPGAHTIGAQATNAASLSSGSTADVLVIAG